MNEEIQTYLVYRKSDGLVVNVTVGKPPLINTYDAVPSPAGDAGIGDTLTFEEDGTFTLTKGEPYLIDFTTLQQDAARV
jgi:hypothetical protein